MSSKIEFYEEQDKIMEKENNKEEKNSTTEQSQVFNLKGGEGFVCGLDCKTCGAT